MKKKTFSLMMLDNSDLGVGMVDGYSAAILRTETSTFTPNIGIFVSNYKKHYVLHKSVE
jgi:hypothetical protein